MWLWILPLVLAVTALWPSREATRPARVLGVVCLVGLAGVTAGWLVAPGPPSAVGPSWLRPAGAATGELLRLDGLGAALAATILGVGGAVSLVGARRGAGSTVRAAGVLLAASCCLVLAADLATLYLAWCVAGLADAVLAGDRRGGRWMVARAGDLALLAAILVIAWQTGTLSLAELAGRVGFVWGSGHPAAALAGLAVLVAAVTRVGAVPLQGRLAAVARREAPWSGLLLAVPPLLGLVLLARLYPVFFLTPAALAATAALGAVTAVSAALSAASRSGVAGLGFAAAAHGGLALTGLAVGGPGVGLALGVAQAVARVLAILTAVLGAGRREPGARPGTVIVATVAATALAGFPWVTGVGVALTGVLRAAPTGPIGNPPLALLLLMSIVVVGFHAARWWWGVVTGAADRPDTSGAGGSAAGPAVGDPRRASLVGAVVVLTALLLLAGPPQAASAASAGGWLVDLIGDGRVPAGLERVEPIPSVLDGFMAPLLALAAAVGLALGLGLTAARPDLGRELAATPLTRRLGELAGAGWYMGPVLRRLLWLPLRWLAGIAGGALDRLAAEAPPSGTRRRGLPAAIRLAGPVALLLLLDGGGGAAWGVDGLAVVFLVVLLGGSGSALALAGRRRPPLEILVALIAACGVLVSRGAPLSGLLWAVAVAAVAGPAGRASGRESAWALGGLALTLPAVLPGVVGPAIPGAGPGAAAMIPAAWMLASLACALAPARLPSSAPASVALAGLGAVAAVSGLRAAVLTPPPPGPGLALGLAVLLLGGLGAAGAGRPGARIAGWGTASVGIAVLGVAAGTEAGLEGTGLLLAAVFLALPWMSLQAGAGAEVRDGAVGWTDRLLPLSLAGLPGTLPFVGHFLCLSAVLSRAPAIALPAVAAVLPLALAAARHARGSPDAPIGLPSRVGRAVVVVSLLAAGLAPGPVRDSVHRGLVDTARRATPLRPADPEILEDGRLITSRGPTGAPASGQQVAKEEPEVRRPLGEAAHEPGVPAVAVADVDPQGQSLVQ